MRSERTRRRAIVVAVLSLLSAVPRVAHADGPDPMTEYRDRFKSGLLRYQAGAIAEAVQWWEPIYRELGPERGWRLAFNLARAYDSLGDTTRAVERYEAFLRETEAREKRGESAEALITREAEEARARLAEIAKTKGRIVVSASDGPVAAKVDGSEPRIAPFVAYVAPGDHVIVFEPGTENEARRPITVAAGEATTVTPPPRPTKPSAVDERPTVLGPPPRATTFVSEHPFPESVVWIAGGVTLASTVFPILTYRAASDFQSKSKLSGDEGTSATAAAYNGSVRADYDAKKTTYYATLAIPLTLAAVTGGLAAFYVLGARTREVPVAASVVPGGAAAVMTTRF